MADGNRPDFEDTEALRAKYAGKLAVDSGPVPIRRWKPQPSVNATAPTIGSDALPNGGIPHKQNLRPEARPKPQASRKGK